MTTYEAWAGGWKIVRFQGRLCRIGVPSNGYKRIGLTTLGGWRRRAGMYFYAAFSDVCEPVSRDGNVPWAARQAELADIHYGPVPRGGNHG